jgi:hypothetical protein
MIPCRGTQTTGVILNDDIPTGITDQTIYEIHNFVDDSPDVMPEETYSNEYSLEVINRYDTRINKNHKRGKHIKFKNGYRHHPNRG